MGVSMGPKKHKNADETSPKTDLNDPHILMKHVLCSTGSWIDENSPAPK